MCVSQYFEMALILRSKKPTRFCSGKNEKIIIKGEKNLFGKEDDRIEEKQCEGCEKKVAHMHNGDYVKIMDWVKDKTIKFVDIVGKQ